MLGTRLNRFAQSGIDHIEGRQSLAEETLKYVSRETEVQLPTVSSSTGAAVTAIIRTR